MGDVTGWLKGGGVVVDVAGTALSIFAVNVAGLDVAAVAVVAKEEEDLRGSEDEVAVERAVEVAVVKDGASSSSSSFSSSSVPKLSLSGP
jgi:hypothetical protein